LPMTALSGKFQPRPSSHNSRRLLPFFSEFFRDRPALFSFSSQLPSTLCEHEHAFPSDQCRWFLVLRRLTWIRNLGLGVFLPLPFPDACGIILALQCQHALFDPPPSDALSTLSDPRPFLFYSQNARSATGSSLFRRIPLLRIFLDVNLSRSAETICARFLFIILSLLFPHVLLLSNSL